MWCRSNAELVVRDGKEEMEESSGSFLPVGLHAAWTTGWYSIFYKFLLSVTLKKANCNDRSAGRIWRIAVLSSPGSYLRSEVHAGRMAAVVSNEGAW